MIEDPIFGANWQREYLGDKLVNYSKLTIRYHAFVNTSKEKQNLLKMIKAKSVAQSLSNSVMEVTWYFVPDTLVELIEKYPWLLDSNLGEHASE